MSKIIIPIFIFTFIMTPIIIHGETEIEKNLKARKEHHAPEGIIKQLSKPERPDLFKIDQVVEILDIKPNMHILDIGAGLGQFTFPIALALQGTGKIYATEVESSVLNQLKMRMEKFPYKNIIPILVNVGGLDPFYTQNSFDIILLSDVYNHLLNREKYFKGLLPSLKKNGRLYIINRNRDRDHFRRISPFLNTIIEILISEREKNFVFQKLNKNSQRLFENKLDPKALPETSKEKIMRNLLAILSDQFFFIDLYNFYRIKENTNLHSVLLKKNSKHMSLIRWLATDLHEKGVFDKLKKGKINLSKTDKKQLHDLNLLLLSGITGIPNLIEDQPILLRIKSDNIISTMEAAGYHFVRSHDILEVLLFLEFKR